MSESFSSSRNRGTVLHNMSCRPNAHVNHRGTDQCSKLLIEGKASLEHWAHSLSLERPLEREILTVLRQCAIANARLKHLPPVTPIIEGAHGPAITGITNDPLFVLAVLTRCSARVLISEKSPVVTTENICRVVTIILPKNWSFKS